MPSALSKLGFLACEEKVTRRVFAAPGTVIAVAVNGILLEPNEGYSCTGTIISMDTPLETGDRVDAFCIA